MTPNTADTANAFILGCVVGLIIGFLLIIWHCEQNPDLRFWQALQSWSGYRYIYGSNNLYIRPTLEDTFYKKGK